MSTSKDVLVFVYPVCQPMAVSYRRWYKAGQRGRTGVRILHCYGLSYIDIMLENTKFNKAAACGFGTVLPLQGMTEFEHELRRKIFL